MIESSFVRNHGRVANENDSYKILLILSEMKERRRPRVKKHVQRTEERKE